MNKELEALEKIGNAKTKDTSFGTEIKTNLPNEYRIIKSALKRLNYIDENKLYCISETYLQDIKKLKALNIIREKRVNVGSLVHDIEEHFMSYETYLANYDCYQDILEPLTQEEFDLLKEVLL